MASLVLDDDADCIRTRGKIMQKAKMTLAANAKATLGRMAVKIFIGERSVVVSSNFTKGGIPAPRDKMGRGHSLVVTSETSGGLDLVMGRES